jgi:hypothetical protein
MAMRVHSTATADKTAQVRVTIEFDESDLCLHKTPYGSIVDFKGARANWPPGAPALPKLFVHVAVPSGRWPVGLTAENAHYVEVTREPTLVVPIQRRRPTATTGRSAGSGDQSRATGADRAIKPSTFRDRSERDAFPSPFAGRPIVLPNRELYEQALRSQSLVRPWGIEHIGLSTSRVSRSARCA